MHKTLYGNHENRIADDSQWDDDQGLRQENILDSDRKSELIDIHTQDIDDMLAELMENHPDQALEVLKIALYPGYVSEELFLKRHWFLREFIPEQCEKLAEKEKEDE